MMDFKKELQEFNKSLEETSINTTKRIMLADHIILMLKESEMSFLEAATFLLDLSKLITDQNEKHVLRKRSGN